MARRVKDARLDSPTGRARLKVRGKPYYSALDREMHLGYRKGKSGGRWCVRYYRGSGAYKVETFALADDASPADGAAVLDFWQAQERARAIRQERSREAAGIEPGDGPYTVAKCIAEYIAGLKLDGKSAGDAKGRADTVILPALGGIECAKLTTARLNKWLADVAKAPAMLRAKANGEANHRALDESDDEAMRARKATANRTWNILRAALNRGWREGKIASDDAWRRVKPFKHVNAARARWLKVDEARRLVNACPPDLRDLVQGALATGCRYGELCRMDCADFDAGLGTVFVGKSKTGAGRHVVLTDEGVALFAALTAGRPGDAPIFRTADGSRWRRSQHQYPFGKAVARAGITPSIDFHGLRHTYASLSIMAGMPLLVAAGNLGHSGTTMLQKHYGHLARDHVVETIRKTAPVFGFTSETTVVPLARPAS
jgi:integrase